MPIIIIIGNYVIIFRKVFISRKHSLRMKRKINRVGVNTLTVSLPSDWTSKHHLKQGDELLVYPEQDKIIFSLTEAKQKEKEITLHIDEMTRPILSKYLTTLYINNFSRIILTYDKTEIYDDKIEKPVSIKNAIRVLSHRFIGMEIVSQTNKRTELSCFILNQNLNLEVIEKRIYHLLHETLQELLEAMNNDFTEFYKTIYDHHDNIIKFMYYYLRVLDCSHKTEEEKKALFAFYMKIDFILDKIRHVTERIQQYGSTSRLKKILKEIFDYFLESFMVMYKGKLSREWVAKRYQLFRKVTAIPFTFEEHMVISEIKIMLDTMNDFHQVIMVREAQRLIT